MNLTPHEVHQLCDRFAQLHDDELFETDREGLEQRLLAEPEVRRLYLRYMRVCAGLAWDLREATTPIEATPTSSGTQFPGTVADGPAGQVVPGLWPVVRVEAVVSGQSTESSAKTPPSKSPVLGFLSPTMTLLNRPVVWSIFAVAVVFYGTFALFSWNLRPDKLWNETASHDFAVAMVRDAADVRWSADMMRKVDNAPIQQGESLKIEAGLVELQLKGGATLLVEAPARWSIDGNNRATLQSGKLIAKVPAQAIGFTLDTPTARIVDLGTEFGVEVDDQQIAEVHVFKGAVEASQLNSALAQNGGVRVTEGHALRIDSQQRQPTPIAIRSKQQFGVAKRTKIKRIDRDMLVAEWDFVQDENLTYAANGASKVARLSGAATIDQGVALGALSGNRQLMSGFLNASRVNGESNDEGIITEANWGQLFGSSDLTSGTFVVVFKPNPTKWVRYVLLSHTVQTGEFGQIFVSFQQNDINTTSEVLLRVGPDDAEAAMNVPALKNTDWYFLGGSWAPGEKSFLYLRNITDGKLCGTAIGNVVVKMREGVMKGPLHLGLRNSYDNRLNALKRSESANSLIAYAALLYPYWNTADKFDQFYLSLIDHPEQKESRSER